MGSSDPPMTTNAGECQRKPIVSHSVIKQKPSISFSKVDTNYYFTSCTNLFKAHPLAPHPPYKRDVIFVHRRCHRYPWNAFSVFFLILNPVHSHIQSLSYDIFLHILQSNIFITPLQQQRQQLLTTYHAGTVLVCVLLSTSIFQH